MSSFQEIRKLGEVITLDFSKEAHREAFCRMYGGEEKMRQKLPLFYEAYEQAKALHEAGNGLAYKTMLQLDEAERQTFTDGIDISCVNYTVENNMLHVEGITSLTEKAFYIDEHLEVQTEAGETVAGTSQSTPDTYQSTLKIDTDFNPKEFASATLLVDYMVTWIGGQSGQLKAQLYSKTANERYYLTNCVDNIALTLPKSDVNEIVTICYNRQPSIKEKVDLTYQEAIVGDKQKLLLDVKGEVCLKAGSAAFAMIDPASFVLKLASRGMAQYNTASRMEEIGKRFANSEKGFAFSLDNDWQDTVPTARLPKKDLVDIQMYAAFNLVDGTHGDFTISSTAEKSQGNVYRAQKLYLLWGCLAEDSLIRMMDGSDRKIQEICIGDRVMLENGESGRVENIWKGTETEPSLCFDTNEGSFCCTGLHPVKTDHGIKRADDITGEDCLINGEGREIPLTGLYPIQVETVYNLDIRNETTEKAEGSLLICNGFLVGDNLMQNTDFSCVGKEAEAVDERIRQECFLKNEFFGRK